jgi:hypothetical protein
MVDRARSAEPSAISTQSPSGMNESSVEQGGTVVTIATLVTLVVGAIFGTHHFSD